MYRRTKLRMSRLLPTWKHKSGNEVSSYGAKGTYSWWADNSNNDRRRDGLGRSINQRHMKSFLVHLGLPPPHLLRLCSRMRRECLQVQTYMNLVDVRRFQARTYLLVESARMLIDSLGFILSICFRTSLSRPVFLMRSVVHGKASSVLRGRRPGMGEI